jgi:DNA-binding transcriptional MerR regulator
LFTIGQVSRHTGVSARTIRFYHAQGVLPEPARDASGYRRYSAREIATLVKIRRLAAAGVPLAEIPDLLAAPTERFTAALTSIDADLAAKIDELQDTRRQLTELASGAGSILPEEVPAYLEQLRAIGLSEFWIELEAELWVTVFACYADQAPALLADQRQAKTDPAVQQHYLAYDRARAYAPDDPRIDDIVDQIVAATRARYPDRNLPVPLDPDPIADLIQQTINAASPVWRRIDTAVRARLKEDHFTHTPAFDRYDPAGEACGRKGRRS